MPSFAVPSGRTLLFVGQDRTTMENYLEAMKIIPAGFTIYTSVQDADGLYDPVDHGGGIHHMQYFLDKYPDTVIQVGLHMSGIMDDIMSKKYDGNIDKLAEYFKGAKRPVYLRIGYEFDFPQNNYEPQKYIEVYRYIRKRFEDKNANNIAYVWHSYAADINRSVMDWYPGDEYVDWFAISFFAQGPSYMDNMARLSKSHNKPFMIAEATPQGIGTLKGQESWDLWFKRLFAFIEEKDVAALCYINCRWDDIPMFQGQGWEDARVEANDIVKRNWLNEISKKRYVLSGDSLYDAVEFSVEK